jgi:hypothetical protein
MEQINSTTTEATLKAAGATVKVGLSQINNPTPQWMSKLANGIIFASLAWALVSPSLPELSPEIVAAITRYVMISSGLIKLATKFFGLQIPEAQ